MARPEDSLMDKAPFVFWPAGAPRCTRDGIPFFDVGIAWYGLMRRTGTEMIAAHGTPPPGAVLSAMRKIAGNHLVGWQEAQIHFYRHWHASEAAWGEPALCYCSYSMLPARPTDDFVHSVSLEVTIIRHKDWQLPDEKEFYCRRLRDWYCGAGELITDNPSPLSLSEGLITGLPGSALTGTLGGQRRHLLAWPTTDRARVIAEACRWREMGAREMQLAQGGQCWAADDLLNVDLDSSKEPKTKTNRQNLL